MSEEKDTKKEILVENSEEQTYELSRILRFILVSSFILLNITYSADVGVIASSKFKLQSDLNFNDKEFATFNSITSTGRILGTFIYMVLLTRDNRKLLTLITLLSSCAIFFSFLFTSQKFVLFGIRFLLGLTRNFFQIYVPVYVDQFGVKPLKTIMISICNITSPLGRALGFAIGTALGESKWRYSFSVIGLILLFLALIIMFSPSRYFAAAAEFRGYYIKNLDNSKLILVSSREDKNKKYSDSVFGTGKIKVKKAGLDFNEVLGILKNPTFMFSTFTRASVSFIFDITHLFIKDYVQKGLGETNQILLLSYYSFASGIGPWVGGTVGGSIVTYVGGYEHKNSARIISIFSVCTLITTYFLCYTNTLFTFSLSLFAFYSTA
jgi:predicted MFS family arabinose efflux permease